MTTFSFSSATDLAAASLPGRLDSQNEPGWTREENWNSRITFR